MLGVGRDFKLGRDHVVSLPIFDFRFLIGAFVSFFLPLLEEDRMLLLSFTQTRKER